MSQPPLKPSRRDLIKAGALTAAFASGLRLPGGFGAAAAETPDPFRGLKVGITSYSVRKLSLDDAIKATQRVGVRYISLKDFHLSLKSTTEERRAVAQKLKDAGLVLLGCGVVSLKNDEAEIRHAFEYAKDAGIGTIVAKPDPASMPILDRMVKEYNIRVAIHNHGPEDKVYPTPDSAAQVIAGHDPRIGLCIDVGHTLRAGVNVADAIRKHAARLYDMHLKDVDRAEPKAKLTEVGRGVMDIPGILRALRAIKYQHHVALEYEKDADDPVPGMAESIGYIRGVLAMM